LIYFATLVIPDTSMIVYTANPLRIAQGAHNYKPLHRNFDKSNQIQTVESF